MPGTDAATYAVLIVQSRPGEPDAVITQGYGVLREILDDIEDEAVQRGWLLEINRG